MGAGITAQLLDLQGAEVPQAALRMMRLSLFDWAACGVAGAAESSFERFKVTAAHGGPGQVALLGGGTAAPGTAALINGTLSHALDYDDTHFAHIGHPSVVVVPAVLAVIGPGVSLEEALAAAAVGAEASIRVGLWLGRDHYQVGFHQTATAGAFGAAVAVARLVGLSKAQARHALGLTSTMASGLKSQFGTMGKPLNAGLAARTGVEAALWAQAGMTSSADGLAGSLGFGATHHGLGTVDVPEAWHLPSIRHKFHACCHGLHAMLEALGSLDVDPQEITRIDIETHPRWMTVCNIAAPSTGLEAKFSYAQTAAMALLGHDTGAAAHFTDAVAQDPQICALRARVQVLSAQTLTETEAKVTLYLRDGSLQRAAHDLIAPVPEALRSQKLRRKAGELIGPVLSDALWEAIETGDMQRFTVLLGSAGPR
ncbi:MAG: MmgE/PrpD family protein [Pseudomonadota bacterium]